MRSLITLSGNPAFCVIFLLVAMIIISAQAQTASHEEVLAALPRLENLAEETVETGVVPGLAIAVVYNDEVVYLRGFRRRETGKPDPVDANTVFQIASCSKPISSTVVAALV